MNTEKLLLAVSPPLYIDFLERQQCETGLS